MPAIKYRVTLSDDEVEMLEALLRKGKSAARKQTRARILLKAAAGCKDAEIMEQCRLNGMGAEREATLIGKVAQQSAALKLARQVLMSVKETSSSTRLRRIVDEPLAAIHEVLKGE